MLLLDGAPPPDLAFEAVHEYEMVVSLPPRHPLTRRGRVTVADLRDEPLVIRPPRTFMRRHIERMVDAAGFTPLVGAECEDMHQIRDLVAQGVGIAVIPSMYAQFHAERTTVRALDAAPSVRVGVAWVRGRYVPRGVRAMIEAWHDWAAAYAAIRAAFVRSSDRRRSSGVRLRITARGWRKRRPA